MSEVRRYRKKPVEIEAMLYDGTNAADVVGWIRHHGGETIVRGGPTGGSRDAQIGVRTLEGTMWASPGDYIIRGVRGEFYPCKPDIFEATYEEVAPAHRGPRILTEPDAARELTCWYDSTLWLPFVESDTADVTGPGHQDKRAFCAAVHQIDRAHWHEIEGSQPSEHDPAEVAHVWALVEERDGEVFVRLADEMTPGALPVTTIWGVR